MPRDARGMCRPTRERSAKRQPGPVVQDERVELRADFPRRGEVAVQQSGKAPQRGHAADFSDVPLHDRSRRQHHSVEHVNRFHQAPPDRLTCALDGHTLIEHDAKRHAARNRHAGLLCQSRRGNPAQYHPLADHRFLCFATCPFYLGNALNACFGRVDSRALRPFSRRSAAAFALAAGALSQATCSVVADVPLNWSTSTAE